MRTAEGRQDGAPKEPVIAVTTIRVAGQAGFEYSLLEDREKGHFERSERASSWLAAERGRSHPFTGSRLTGRSLAHLQR